MHILYSHVQDLFIIIYFSSNFYYISTLRNMIHFLISFPRNIKFSYQNFLFFFSNDHIIHVYINTYNKKCVLINVSNVYLLIHIFNCN